MMNENKTVDVAIPAYKPSPEMGKLLDRLLHQSYPVHQIHITNTDSSGWPDALQQAIEKMNRGEKGERILMTHISKEAFDHGGTRDAMMRESGADYVLFLTQDVEEISLHLVEYMVRALASPGVAACYGRQLPRKQADPLETFTRQFNYPKEGHLQKKEDLPVTGIKTFFCSNVCSMLKRKVYLDLGGFPHHTIFNEDMIYGARVIEAGYAIQYEARATVVHSHHYSGKQQLKRNFDLGVSHGMFPQVFEGVPAEGEGLRLVRKTAAYLWKNGQVLWIFPLLYQSGCKYLGYRLGKAYRHLPRSLCLRWSSNPGFWAKKRDLH